MAGKLNHFLCQPVGQFEHHGAGSHRGNTPRPALGTINVILAKPRGELGASSRVMSVRSGLGDEVVETGNQIAKKVKLSAIPTLVFPEEDKEGTCQPHDDALVVTVRIRGYDVKRVLVDQGSGAEIMYPDLFNGLNLKAEDLERYDSPLVGFDGKPVIPQGMIKLPIQVENEEVQVNFIVVKAYSPYMAISARPWLHAMGAVSSTLHVKVKYPTRGRAGVLLGQLRVRRREEDHLADLEETFSVLRKHMYPTRGCSLIDFACKGQGKTTFRAPNGNYHYQVMPFGLKNTGSTYQRMVTRMFESQLGRNMEAYIDDMVIKSRREEDHLADLEDTFSVLRKHMYPTRGCGLVEFAFKKKNGKWRVYVDFTDLNKVCPKDPFPIPRIDQLVNATVGHPRMSFLDAFQGYHQIPLSLSDQEKTAFCAPNGNYHCQVMPFGLKNARSTYQRMVTRMFESQLGRNMEAYIDDMVIKFRRVEDHLADLEEMFLVLRKHKLHLNASKCSFGVSSGKFLGYMIMHRGIEVNPDQIKAIVGLHPPQNPKEVQMLTGMAVALNRSRSADKCRPFYQLLHKWKDFQWTKECALAFEDLKQYLASPPIFLDLRRKRCCTPT
ncbi:uncharacterized protein LOC142626848 [Castanea sativa]|uniref:uncharacterized protein LOC142626848 n=1 Tax=Castanea sativa TaxID=21020 RepID=UPI003F65166B